MAFTFRKTPIPDVLIIESRLFHDERGYFLETYKKSDFEGYIKAEFNQDNYSFSKRGVIRGLHFQRGENAQGKVVRVVHGSIFDVAVDLRSESETYGQYISVELNSDNHNAIWIPPGLAHGFQALEDSIVQYKATTEYAPGSEGVIVWNDPDRAVARRGRRYIRHDRHSRFARRRARAGCVGLCPGGRRGSGGRGASPRARS